MPIFRSCAVALALVSASVVASPEPAQLPETDAPAVPSALTEAAKKLQLTIQAAADSPIAGLKEITTDRGVFYMSDDGQHFLAGHLFDLSAQPVNLTERRQAEVNVSKMVEMADEMIVYPAKDEKHVVTVFTDTSCGYCRKMHEEMADYNNAGITVRYLAFPRSGLNAGNFGQLSAIWCAEDQIAAMDEAKAGGFNQSSTACDTLVRGHYELGVQMGIRGTPAIILEDGNVIPGYQPAGRLLQTLEQNPG
ncbi:bifunctional protein-disulfide isomerase/oxidoreductase DsbC [Thaumasiovibrio subtropicus]|uniref:bifunctional protein-disulfide isomerase/oxidoreductase DsbC n=1 Tax=Thaumasiovibrio subtropicus TaxID=1891207 RepID=UPI000B35C1DC|nr:bifunctional protein-disulfide isomerase/oxidoreductase DsbC [Thaumasiovibrio subtropicus]